MAFFTVLFNGISYGMLLFIIAVGLSVTMGMMKFVNLMHLSLAMAGGYLLVSLTSQFGLSFFVCLPVVFVATGILSVLLERGVLRFFYAADELTQVLLTVGLVFLASAITMYFFGSNFQPIHLPDSILGQTLIMGVTIDRYRIFLFVIGIFLALAMTYGLERTKFGAMVRACVDNRRAASGSGLNLSMIFSVTFAIGGGLAGLGGALSANLLGLDPMFAQRYLVYALIVTSVGGQGSIKGTLLASVVMGMADSLGKYYLDQLGGVVIYALTVIIMLWRPTGFFGRAT
jgi:branched-chain amino acid transport system permease protein